MNSLHGPHKDTIDSLQQQIDFHVGEASRLRYARNSYVAVSSLQPELLSEVFLYLVESGLRGGNSYFAPGTFSFLQVCRRWNEVAVGFSQLWSLWVAGAAKAWPLFNSRSRGGPLSLTWRPQLLNSARDILMDPTIPRRTQRLDFSGTSDQLAHFFGAFDPSLPSNALSIRLQIHMPWWGNRKKLASLLPSSFPKLSKLNVGNFLPKSSSPIFTTSKLTSLKLFLPYAIKGRHNMAQFSRILRQHPSLQELDLNNGAIPMPGTSGAMVPFTLPRLVDLRLRGMEGDTLGFVDFIGMSSPLHNVAIHLDYLWDPTATALASAVEKILVAYYNCQEHPRKIYSVTISSPRQFRLVLESRSRSVPTSSLEIKFRATSGLAQDEMVDETFAIFPSDDVQEFTVEDLPLTHRTLQEMENLLHLRLCHQDRWDFGQALDALSLSNPGASTKSASAASVSDHIHTCR